MSSISPSHPCIQRSIRVTAQFGFLSRDIFEAYLAPGQRYFRWKIWTKLLSLGLFRFYRDPLGRSDIIAFSRGALIRFSYSQEFGNLKPVRPVPIQNITHDQHVMSFALHNENEKLIENIQTEAMLKRDGNERFSVGHKGRKIKYPDLLFSLAVPGKNIQAALEVERTRKTFQAYKAFLIAYASLPGIDFVIVACETKAIEKALKESMRLMNYPSRQRPIAFCLIAEMQKSPSDFPLDLNGNVTTLRQIVENLSAQSVRAA
jgi:hypothetical protein